jgi:catechol 2,3-dioxygenase-like lactoylglutathione lyase family enzyme
MTKNYKTTSFEATFSSKDLKATEKFYNTFFDAKTLHHNENYLILQIEQTFVHFCSMPETHTGDGIPQNAHGNINVSNADEARKFILEENSENESNYKMTDLRDDPWGMRAFEMQDPNGLHLYISHPINNDYHASSDK